MVALLVVLTASPVSGRGNTSHTINSNYHGHTMGTLIHSWTDIDLYTVFKYADVHRWDDSSQITCVQGSWVIRHVHCDAPYNANYHSRHKGNGISDHHMDQ